MNQNSHWVGYPGHRGRRVRWSAPRDRLDTGGCRRARIGSLVAVGASTLLLLSACAGPRRTARPQRPNVAPPTEPACSEPLKLDASLIRPMHREMLSVDLSTLIRVAAADSLDIKQARAAVKASRGRLQARVGAAFPALVPTAVFDHVEGTVRATEGNLVGVGFNTFQPSVAVQWVLNPGKVIYEIIAAKKRLAAAEHQERAIVLETLRNTAIEYYELVLSQARVSAAHKSVAEADELLRISHLHAQTGTGVPADELRAEARLGARRQELLLALKAFYDASVALAVTLHLEDATVTLVPRANELPPVQLVRGDLDLDELVGLAVAYRPDLDGVRLLARAAGDDRGATWWGALGPQFQMSYQYGGITGRANNVKQASGLPGNLIVNPLSSSGAFADNPVANGFLREGVARGSRLLGRNRDQTFSFSDQQRFGARAGARWSLAAIGELKTAGANQQRALLDAQQQLDRVKAQVVRAFQASRTHSALIHMAGRQVAAAREALRLTQANLQAGTMTALDVLQAQEAAAQARLRHAQAVVRYNQAEVNLVAAIGLLTPEALAATAYAPSDHANEPRPSGSGPGRADQPGPPTEREMSRRPETS